MDFLNEVVGDDGYVEWHKLLQNVKTPKNITFVNPLNKALAVEKLNICFDTIEKKFDNDEFLENKISDMFVRLCLENVKIDMSIFKKESVSSFLHRVKDAVKQNEIFLTYFLNFDKPLGSEIFDLYICDIVTYCYVLEVLTVNLMKDENLFQEILEKINQKRNSIDWKKHASMFQRAKVASILPFIPGLSPKKVKESFENKKYVDDTYSPLSRLGLTVNITEAVLEDLNHGNIKNAKAGYELALLDGLLDFSKFSNEKRVLIARTSSMYRYSAIPRNWSDLYNAWNLTFVGNFPEFPYYASKLLFPEVSNYQNRPHQYLYPRLIGLWLHIHYILYEAVYGHERKYDMNLPKDILEKLGKINLTYAKAYRKFYDKLNYKLSPKCWIPVDFINDKIQRVIFFILMRGVKRINKLKYLINILSRKKFQ